MKILSLIQFIREFFRVTWYSVSSKKFYPDLYTKYKGFGIKYIATIISFTTLIYVILAYGNLLTLKYYLANENDENNPVEFVISQWPEVTYEGGEISWAEAEPLLITYPNGKTIMAIDPESKLSEAQSNKIPIILKSRRILFSLGSNNEKRSARTKDMSIGYKKIFGKEDMILTSDTLRDKIIEMIESISIFMLILLLPILAIVRLFLHIVSNLFSILILFLIFLWMGMKPTIKSSTRVIMFTSGAAEVLAIILVLIIPKMLFLASMIEYWAIILAIYSITKYCRPHKN